MDLLGQLFGSQTRIKLMRLFLFHEGTFFSFEEIVERTLAKKDTLKKEMKLLEKIGFLKRGIFLLKEKKTLKSGKVFLRKRKVQGWKLNPRFELNIPLKSLLIETQLIREKDILSLIRKSGKLKLLILSGIFTGVENSQVDMLIVVDQVNRSSLERNIRKMESEIGKELLYAVFTLDEFRYRLDMYDKLVRKVLENHKKVLFQHSDIHWN